MKALCKTVAAAKLDGELLELDDQFRVNVTIYQGLSAQAHKALDVVCFGSTEKLDREKVTQTFNSKHFLLVQRMRESGFILMSKQHAVQPVDCGCCHEITSTCYWSWLDPFAMELHDAMAERRWYNRLQNWMKRLWDKLTFKPKKSC